MKHIHADLIRRWANNTSLVILIKPGKDCKWRVLDDQTSPSWYPNYKYFLIAEKHSDVILHWLNGGTVECTTDDSWTKLLPYKDGYTIDPNRKYRIVPEPIKKTLWVGYPKNDIGNPSVVLDEIPVAVWISRYTWTQVEVDHLAE